MWTYLFLGGWPFNQQQTYRDNSSLTSLRHVPLEIFKKWVLAYLVNQVDTSISVRVSMVWSCTLCFKVLNL